MALGAAFLKWATAGLALQVVVSSPSQYRPTEGAGETALSPWNIMSIDGRLRGTDWQLAQAIAGQVLVKAQSANRLRLTGVSTGLIVHADLDISGQYNDIGRTDCYVSSLPATVCIVTIPNNIRAGMVASHINSYFGNDISGISDGANIVFPSASTQQIPLDVSTQNNELVLMIRT